MFLSRKRLFHFLRCKITWYNKDPQSARIQRASYSIHYSHLLETTYSHNADDRHYNLVHIIVYNLFQFFIFL